MFIWFSGWERFQRGRGIGGLLRLVKGLFKPVIESIGKAMRSNTRQAIGNALKDQPINTAKNVPTDVITGNPLTLWATGGGWFSPHSFYRAATEKITLMRHFFYCFTFQVDAARSFWYHFCGHTPLGSQARVRQSQNTTKKSNFGKIQNGRHWSYSWSEKKV